MGGYRQLISKYLLSFLFLLLLLLLLNAALFIWTFYDAVREDYGGSSPSAMLDHTAAHVTASGLDSEAAERLQAGQIWAFCLDAEGRTAWALDAPVPLPERFSVQDVALFAKGYLEGYPVFIRNLPEGMLVLAYPKDSYMKLSGNYFSLRTVRAMPVFALGLLAADLLLLFAAYFFSKKRLLQSTGPIIVAIEGLAQGNPMPLTVQGELSQVAECVNSAAHMLRRQNQARANWIAGVSHDIRTPLSLIMGYAGRMARDETASPHIKDDAECISRQAGKIKELVNDLNLVSRLEYEMQPIQKESVRLSGLIRSCAADLLNAGLPKGFDLQLDISPAAEGIFFACDKRLIFRAIGNLTQNSIRHNPNGCRMLLSLDYSENALLLSVADDGVGITEEKRKELLKPHYIQSADERLDLRHGLGLLLVRQIAQAHGGSMTVASSPGEGFKTTMSFPLTAPDTEGSCGRAR